MVKTFQPFIKLKFNKDLPVYWMGDKGKIINLLQRQIYCEFRTKKENQLYGCFFDNEGNPIDNLTGNKIQLNGNPQLTHRESDEK